MKVVDIAVVGGGDRIEVDLLGQVVGALTRDQVGRGRLDDALLVVGDLRHHGRVGVHAHDNGVLVLCKPDQIVVIAERLKGRLVNAHGVSPSWVATLDRHAARSAAPRATRAASLSASNPM